MIPVVISRYLSLRDTMVAVGCAILLAAASTSSVAAQSVDWHSTLALHFDPSEHVAASSDQRGTYLSQIADGLDSGWIAETGAAVVVVGPVFLSRESERDDYGRIDSVLGSFDEWTRLTSAAKRSDIAVAIDLRPVSSWEDLPKLAGWAAETGIRHFIIDSGSSGVAALREALDAHGSAQSWIIGADAPDNSSAAGADGVASAGLRQADTNAYIFDGLIESLSANQLGDDSALGTAYETFGHRIAASPIPLIASFSLPAETAHSSARLLMMPGALLVTTSTLPSDSSRLWRQIAAFRARHPAVRGGEHVTLVNSTFTFARTSTDQRVDDRVIVVLGASGPTTINVSRIYPDDALLQDALTGRTAFVSFGMASFDPGPSGIILVEEAD